MKHLLIIGLLLVPTMALAQQAPPELTFKFSTQETDVVWEALREMPVKRVEGIMNKMRQQVMEQTQPKAAVTDPGHTHPAPVTIEPKKE